MRKKVTLFFPLGVREKVTLFFSLGGWEKVTLFFPLGMWEKVTLFFPLGMWKKVTLFFPLGVQLCQKKIKITEPGLFQCLTTCFFSLFHQSWKTIKCMLVFCPYVHRCPPKTGHYIKTGVQNDHVSCSKVCFKSLYKHVVSQVPVKFLLW